MAPRTQLSVEPEHNLLTASAHRSRRTRAGLAVMVVITALLVGGALTLAHRATERKALAATTERLAIETVSVVRPSVGAPSQELLLPATLQAYSESPLFARTNGYLLRWYTDIGTHVRKGQLLADIDTPEVDNQLMQARASRDQLNARLQLAKISAERWKNLRETDSVSQQEADERSSAYQQAQADLAAADANVRRLEELEGFKHIYAPFSGVVTERNVDVGALVNAGSGGSNKELFVVAQMDPLRVYVRVPQSYFPYIRIGIPARLVLNEFPGKTFQGKVVRTADAIDPQSRTLLTEIDVPNHDGKLLPGSYAEAHFDVHIDAPRLSLPVNALLFRPSGSKVAVVTAENRIHLKNVSIGRDYGTTVEVMTGVEPSDQVVINPADSLEEGQQVQLMAPEDKQR